MKLAFYKAKDHIFNRAVAWWTGGPYSHVEVILGATEDKFVCASASNRDHGVRFKTMTLPFDRWDIIEVTAGDQQKAFHWFEAHAGQGYDMLGLFGFVLHRGLQDPKKWFCSEAVAAALGYNEPWRYDPNTLFALLTNGDTHA
jgi:hypothetical protein